MYKHASAAPGSRGGTLNANETWRGINKQRLLRAKNNKLLGNTPNFCLQIFFENIAIFEELRFHSGKIANELNSHGVIMANGGRWKPMHIIALLARVKPLAVKRGYRFPNYV